MTIRDDQAAADGGGPESTVTGRWGGRRTKIALGVVGLAAVLGAGAYTITDRLTGPRGETTHNGALVRQPLPIDPASKAVTQSASSSASASATSLDPHVVASIKAARDKMVKDGVKVTRPLPTQSTGSPVVGLARSDDGSLKAGGIVRVVTARSDLTGREELGWVAGGVTSYGDNKCSQTFRLFNSPRPAKKPNLLMCWRTSAKKSVVAVVVDPKGKPSRAKALDVLERKWREMN
jgi:hypothetical protein